MSAVEAMNASSHHLIVGGQRSGKSRHAERMGQTWLQAQPGRKVVVLATGGTIAGTGASSVNSALQPRFDRLDNCLGGDSKMLIQKWLLLMEM